MNYKKYPVQGLWVGTQLSPIESYCIKSYIKQGHDFHLYGYNDFATLPKGTILKDANSIIPENQIFRYKSGPGKGSLAAFADLFRYHLLSEKGGWWTDMDFLCMNPLKQPSCLFLAGEFQPRRARNNSHQRPWGHINRALKTIRSTISTKQLKGRPTSSILQAMAYKQSPTCSLMYAEPNHPVMIEAASESKRLKDTDLRWGAIGPNLVASLAKKHQKSHQILIGNAKEYMPISYDQIKIILQPSNNFKTESIKTIHLYNEVWRQNNIDKNNPPGEGSLFQHIVSKALDD